MHGLIYHFISDDEMLRISNSIKKAEETTAGEIRVAIKEHLHFFERFKSIKELAEKEFYRLGINKTKDKTGILIFIVLPKRGFYIMADTGIHAKVADNTWDSIKDEIQKMFSYGQFSRGIINAVQSVGKILSQHFPINPNDTNELSNQIVIE